MPSLEKRVAYLERRLEQHGEQRFRRLIVLDVAALAAVFGAIVGLYFK